MKLYVYDHCPFCVKARMILGLKNIPFELVTMLNDDEATPTRMIGKKMAPILEDEGRYIPESMDIVAYVDKMSQDRVLDGPRNPQITDWLSGMTGVLYRLTQPRWAASPLPEFATPQARAYFTRNKQAMFGSFADLLAASAKYIAQMDRHLLTLNTLIVSPDAVNGALSEDDLHLFATLRALSIVRGFSYPPLVHGYRKRMAQRTEVELHDNLAT
jgi:glutaredoxin 2